MKYYLILFVLAAMFIVGCCCERSANIKEQQVNSESEEQVVKEVEEESPLLLDDEPLLLLDDYEDSEQSNGGPQADNSRCFVCHMNFVDEDIAVTHAKANIGCKDCHGESDEHIADESWASGGNGTAPDTMFLKPKINPFCMGCHPKEKIDTPQHRPVLMNAAVMVCTDCHGKHRITTPRKCKWK